MANGSWTQRELEELFVRRDTQTLVDRGFDDRIDKLENIMEWFQRLVIGQGVVLIVAIIIFVVERVTL